MVDYRRNYREKIVLDNGTIVKELNWLKHWKQKNKKMVNKIREKVKKENPFTLESKIDKMVNEEILESVLNGTRTINFGLQDIVDNNGSENEIDEKREAIYKKLHKSLNKLSPYYKDIVKMYFGLDKYYFKNFTFYEIAMKYKVSPPAIFKSFQKAMIILRQHLKDLKF